jgi:hypothetical protein
MTNPWFRSYGNELWKFDENGLMRAKPASAMLASPKPTAACLLCTRGALQMKRAPTFTAQDGGGITLLRWRNTFPSPL